MYVSVMLVMMTMMMMMMMIMMMTHSVYISVVVYMKITLKCLINTCCVNGSDLLLNIIIIPKVTVILTVLIITRTLTRWNLSEATISSSLGGRVYRVFTQGGFPRLVLVLTVYWKTDQNTIVRCL